MNRSIAIISDIHGNSWALQAVLQDIKKRPISRIFNLGDSLYGPLDPKGTFHLLQQHDVIHISGNEDRLIVESFYGSNKKNPTMNFVISEINSEVLTWLQTLPPTVVISDFFLCHGTPSNDNEYLFEKITSNGMRLKNKNELQNDIDTIPQKIICCGHSHLKHCLQLPSGKYIVNPGSVGLPAYIDTIPFQHKMESGSPHASYSIITKENNRYKIDQITLTYPWEEAAQYAEKNNRKDWARWLRSGTV
jgi:putative phosphoesterase